MKQTVVLLFFLFLTGPCVFSMEAKIEKYDIDFQTAYELMLNNNNSIKAILEEIKVRRYKKNSALGEFLPKVGMNATFIHFDKDIRTEVSSLNTNGGVVSIPNLTIQDKNLGVFGFNAIWNIFTGGKIIAMNSAARAELMGANLKYKSLVNNLTTKLVQYYYGLAFLSDVAIVKKMVMDMAEEHLNDAIKMEKVGLIPKSERLHAEVAYRQAKKDYESALKDVLIAEESLKNLIKADNVDLRDVSVAPQSFLFIFKGELPTLSELRELALKNNPDFKQTDVQKRLVQANYRASAANYSPVVSLFAYDIAAQANLASQLPRFGLGASVNFMLFNGFSRYNDLRAADAQRQEVKFATIAAQNDIETLVIKNYNELQKFKDEYESTDKSIENANESLRCARLAFREGYGTSLRVIDAQTSLAAIKLQRLNALYNYDVKLAEILANIGQSEKILEYLKNSTEERL